MRTSGGTSCLLLVRPPASDILQCRPLGVCLQQFWPEGWSEHGKALDLKGWPRVDDVMRAVSALASRDHMGIHVVGWAAEGLTCVQVESAAQAALVKALWADTAFLAGQGVIVYSLMFRLGRKTSNFF